MSSQQRTSTQRFIFHCLTLFFFLILTEIMVMVVFMSLFRFFVSKAAGFLLPDLGLPAPPFATDLVYNWVQTASLLIIV